SMFRANRCAPSCECWVSHVAPSEVRPPMTDPPSAANAEKYAASIVDVPAPRGSEPASRRPRDVFFNLPSGSDPSPHRDTPRRRRRQQGLRPARRKALLKPVHVDGRVVPAPKGERETAADPYGNSPDRPRARQDRPRVGQPTLETRHPFETPPPCHTAGSLRNAKRGSDVTHSRRPRDDAGRHRRMDP